MSDRAAFEAIFHAHHRLVYAYAVRRVGPGLAGDAMSETFLVAWRRYDQLRGEPLPWLLGIARRVCANQLRARARSVALEHRIAAEPWMGALEGDPDHEVLGALARLRDADREALMLVAWDGLDNSQAARVAGCAPATFAVRLHRARRRLRVELGRVSAPAQARCGERTVANEVS